DVSLMPDGLAQNLTDSELVDLIAFLATLRQPVAIAGQYHVLGPVADAAKIDPAATVDLDAAVDDGRGRKLSWRRVNAHAEGLVDLSGLAGGDAKGEATAYLFAPLVSPVAQRARLVLDTPAEAAAWVNGKTVSLAASGDEKGGPRVAELDLPDGTGSLLTRVPRGGSSATRATIVTRVVSDQPVGFAAK